MGNERSSAVLAPVDGSSNSLRALAYLAGRTTAIKNPRVIVLNVQPPIPPSLFVSRDMIDQHHQAKSDEALKSVRRFLAKHHIHAEIVVAIGEPAATIVQFARRMHCREIVMGTRGLGGLKGLLLGSVTTKVVHLTRVPVTVVP